MPNKYVFDLKRNIPEVNRLKDQGGVITNELPPVPEGFDAPEGTYVDKGCGAGDWALAMGAKFPKSRVIGIDIYREGIDYANTEATLAGHSNVEFYKGDIFKPEQLPHFFQDESYDLVNARLLAGVIDGNKEAWIAFASECKRLCKKGGWVQLTEADFSSIPNAEAIHQMMQAEMRVLHRLGKCFSEYEMAVCPLLESFLKSAGFVDIQRYTYSIDYSADKDVHDPLVRDFLEVPLRLKSLLVQEFGSEAGFEKVHQQMAKEFNDPEFAGLWYFTRVTGRKP